MAHVGVQCVLRGTARTVLIGVLRDLEGSFRVLVLLVLSGNCVGSLPRRDLRLFLADDGLAFAARRARSAEERAERAGTTRGLSPVR